MTATRGHGPQRRGLTDNTRDLRAQYSTRTRAGGKDPDGDWWGRGVRVRTSVKYVSGPPKWSKSTKKEERCLRLLYEMYVLVRFTVPHKFRVIGH